MRSAAASLATYGPTVSKYYPTDKDDISKCTSGKLLLDHGAQKTKKSSSGPIPVLSTPLVGLVAVVDHKTDKEG